MPGTTGGRPTSGTRKTTYRRARRRRAPAPKSDVTLGGDRTPKRSGHTRPRNAPASQGHPSRGGKTVSGGTKRHPKTRAYKSPTPSVRKQRQERRQIRAGRRLARKLTLEQRREVESRPEVRRAIKLARTPKRDTDTHIGPFNIEAELEGRGGLAKAAKFAKKVVSTDVGQSAVRAAGVPSTGNPKYDKALARDLVDLPAQAIPSTYAVVAGAKEAAQGRPQRIKKVAKQLKEHDPVVLAARGKFKRAGKEIEKHPGLFALEASGVGSAISRGLGAGVRGAARVAPTKGSRRALRKVGTRKRAPAVAPGTAIREPRKYSKGLVGKGAQVAVERTKIRSAHRLRQKAKRTRDPRKKAGLREQANRRDPRILNEPQINRRVDEREGMAHARQQKHRAEAVKEAGRALPKKHADISLLIAQRIVKPTRESLSAFKRDLDRQLKSGNLSKSQALATRKLRDQVSAALKDKKLDLKALEEAGVAYARVVGPRQKELVRRGTLAPEQERMAKLIPVAVKEMGAKWNPQLQRLELRGEKLPVSRIESYLRSTGRDPDEIPYVPQAPGQRGARNFFMSWHEPKGIPSKRRTGEAVRKGSFELNREVGRENVARQQGLIDAHNEYAGFVGENAYRAKGKRIKEFNNRDEALNWGREHLADSPYEWAPVPTRPQFGRKAQSEALLDQADAMDVGIEKVVRDGIAEALEGKSGGGKWVLVPATAAKRKASHARLLGSTGTRLTRKMGRQFSGTVLTTGGFTWPLGNVAEASLRTLIKRAGPTSWALGRKTVERLRKLDPEMADELDARIGTGHLGAYELNHVHTTAKTFQGKAFVGPVARATGAFFRAPGPKQVAQLWNAWTHTIFGANGFIEHQFRTALLGRYLKDEGYNPTTMLPKEGINAISAAAEQAAKGMRGTDEQVMAARYIDRAYGKYSNWSPEMRFTIAVFTPFVAWSLNAVNFMLSVLPKDHPVLTGLLASAERATEEWRHEHGLGKYIDGAAPNWMQPSIPVGGKLVPVGRYTPFGFWADPLETGGSQLLPQINGVVLASKGLDWKGDPLNGHERADDVSEAERAEAIAKVAAGAFVPFFGLHERIKEKGGTALNPLRAYEHNQKVSAAFDESERIEKKKATIKAKHPKVDSDNPTPEYERLHRRWRELQELIYKESKGKYGHKFKEPYRPQGKSSDDGGRFDFGESDGGRYAF